MRARSAFAAVSSLALSLPFSMFALDRADKTLHGWKRTFCSPGYDLATLVDSRFPERAHLMDGLGRFLTISLGVNCLLYGMLLYPVVRVFLVPWLLSRFPKYQGDAFWMN